LDPTSPLYAALIWFGVTPKEIAGGLLVLAAIGYSVAHMVAWGWISPPKSATGIYAKLWPILNTVAANYGQATSVAAVLASAAVRPVPDAQEKSAGGAVKLPCILLLCGLGAALSGCGSSAVASLFGATTVAGETTGQLYCNIARSDGTSMIVSVVDAALDVPVVVTNIAALVVDTECGRAAAAVGAAAGAPTPKPADPALVVTPVAITTPAQVKAGQSAPG
jgi:hypothetical protein